MNAMPAGNAPAAQMSLAQASSQAVAVSETSPKMAQFFVALDGVQLAADSVPALPLESDVAAVSPSDVNMDSTEYMRSMQSSPNVQMSQWLVSAHAETAHLQDQPDQVVQRIPQEWDTTLVHVNAAMPVVPHDEPHHAWLAQRAGDQHRMMEISAQLPVVHWLVGDKTDLGAGAAQPATPVEADVTSKTPVLTSFSVRQSPQALVQALSQRIQVQHAQGVDVATVRLDPPEMGSLEIRIRQDGSGVHVQMHASHAEVGRQLATAAEGLRSELQQRVQDATVTVAHSRFGQSSDHKQREQHSEQTPEEALIHQALQG